MLYSFIRNTAYTLFINFSEKPRETTFSVVWDGNEYDYTEIKQLYENHVLIWLDHHFTDLNLQLVTDLHAIISHIEPIKSIDTCTEYLSTLNKNTQQIFLVICDILPKLDLDDLLEKILEFDGYVYFWQSPNEISFDHHIRGSFLNREELIIKIVNDFQNVKENKFNGMSTCSFDINRVRYKCFQLLMEVLQRTQSSRDIAKENMIKYCERNSEIKLDKRVEEFRNQYEGHNAIQWYSKQSFFKKIFDRDLRSTDFNLISNFSFYLTDLYNALHKKSQSSSTKTNEFIVYRGLTLPIEELQEFKEKVGCFISNNTFLSTTCQHDIALLYAANNNNILSCQSVIFDIHINSKNIQRPFADISDISHIEGEILLCIGTVFRIDSVYEPQSNETGLNIWAIKLTVCEKEPPVLEDYFDIIFLRLIEILRRISSSSDKINDKLLERCRLYYSHDPIELRKIDDFEKSYRTDQAIRWYAKDSFLFRILNAALRQNDIKTIIDLRCFIIDLHDQLTISQIEYLRTLPVDAKQQLKLYRGQLMSKIELTKLKKLIGNYISINSFFSTSVSEKVALMYSGYGSHSASSSFESVVFIITLNLHQIADANRPIQRTIFALMDRFSAFKDEEEVLLSNQNIFRLNSIEKRSDYPVWSIYMTLCIEDEHLNNTHRYLDTILSPNIYFDLNNFNSTFSFKKIICSDNLKQNLII